MKKNQKNKLTKIITIAFFISLPIFILIFFMLPKISKMAYFDKNAKNVKTQEEKKEEILAELQKYADASNFEIDMNVDLKFENSSSVGNIYIANPQNNTLDMKVDIYLNETGEIIYKSGILKPGDLIEKDSLRKDIPKGSYDATAIISAVAPNTEVIMGEVELEVKIDILK